MSLLCPRPTSRASLDDVFAALQIPRSAGEAEISAPGQVEGTDEESVSGHNVAEEGNVSGHNVAEEESISGHNVAEEESVSGHNELPASSEEKAGVGQSGSSEEPQPSRRERVLQEIDEDLVKFWMLYMKPRTALANRERESGFDCTEYTSDYDEDDDDDDELFRLCNKDARDIASWAAEEHSGVGMTERAQQHDKKPPHKSELAPDLAQISPGHFPVPCLQLSGTSGSDVASEVSEQPVAECEVICWSDSLSVMEGVRDLSFEDGGDEIDERDECFGVKESYRGGEIKYYYDEADEVDEEGDEGAENGDADGGDEDRFLSEDEFSYGDHEYAYRYIDEHSDGGEGEDSGGGNEDRDGCGDEGGDERGEENNGEGGEDETSDGGEDKDKEKDEGEDEDKGEGEDEDKDEGKDEGEGEDEEKEEDEDKEKGEAKGDTQHGDEMQTEVRGHYRFDFVKGENNGRDEEGGNRRKDFGDSTTARARRADEVPMEVDGDDETDVVTVENEVSTTDGGDAKIDKTVGNKVAGAVGGSARVEGRRTAKKRSYRFVRKALLAMKLLYKEDRECFGEMMSKVTDDCKPGATEKRRVARRTLLALKQLRKENKPRYKEMMRKAGDESERVEEERRRTRAERHRQREEERRRRTTTTRESSVGVSDASIEKRIEQKQMEVATE